MIDETSSTLSDVLSQRRENLRLAAFAFIAAIAVGVFSSSLTKIFEGYQKTSLLGSAAIILAFVLFIVRDVSNKLSFHDKTKAALLFNLETGETIAVDDYEFSEKFEKVLSALEAENRAIFSDWTGDPICRSQEPDDTSDDEEAEDTDVNEDNSEKPKWLAITRVFNERSETLEERKKSILLLEEITEYLLLEKLSTHLSGYFGEFGETDRVSELERKDIPDFLLENRVLNLLSTPIEQREIFLDAFPEPENRPKGEVVTLWGSNGAVFSRFDLNLPTGSKVQKLEGSGFRISTSRFYVDIRCHFSGYSSVTPRGFEELALNTSVRKVDAKTIQISVSGKVKATSLLRGKGWEYHAWLDSFRNEVRSTFDFEGYFRSIHWDSLEPMFRIGLPIMSRMIPSKRK